VLGAGTVLAKVGRDRRGNPRVALDDEPRVIALLATAYEQPVEPLILAKMRRACELWNEGDKALAHIHLAHADLPRCYEVRALRLFAADELLESGVTPQALLKAQGYDPAPLALLKYSPDQPRVPAGNGRESGRWTSDATITPASYRTKARIKALRDFIEWLRSQLKGPKSESPPERTPPREQAKPTTKPSEAEEPLEVNPNKLHHIFDKKGRELDEFLSRYDSEEAAFRAIEDATRRVITEQEITGQYKIQIEIDGYKLGVAGKVMPDGAIKIGTAYPWKD
jgi:hypothetical protein